MPNHTCVLSLGMFEESILIDTIYGTASIPVKHLNEFIGNCERFMEMVVTYQHEGNEE